MRCSYRRSICLSSRSAWVDSGCPHHRPLAGRSFHFSRAYDFHGLPRRRGDIVNMMPPLRDSRLAGRDFLEQLISANAATRFVIIDGRS